jgi:hypothetical protein
MAFANRDHKVAQFALDQSRLSDGDNTVTLTVAGGSGDASLVDYLRLTYGHTFSANSNALGVKANGSDSVRLGGFTEENVRVFDVTDPSMVYQCLTSTVETGAGRVYDFMVPGSNARKLYAFSDSNILRPVIAPNTPSSLSASVNSADLLIVTSNDLRQSVEPLAELRRRQGMRVMVVNVEDVFDEFGSAELHGRGTLRFRPDEVDRCDKRW